MTLPVAIVAGGLATRLGDVARDLPKSLVEIAGDPFIVWQLKLLRQNGVTDVVVCTGHLGAQIEATVGDGARWNVSVRYSSDGPGPLGTGGAVRRARALLGEAFFVLYGDSYLECDYREAARRFEMSGRCGLMTVFRNEGRWDRSNVEYAGGRLLRYDKKRQVPSMRHIDYGLGVFRASAFDRYEEDAAVDLATVYQDLLAAGELAAYEVTSRFYEVGTPEGLEETRRHLGYAEHKPCPSSS